MAKDTTRKPEKSAGSSFKVVKGGRDAAPAAGKEKASKPSAAPAQAGKSSHGKRVQFDLETWHALNMLARDRMMTFQELADEAFADLLSKHDRPRDLKDALRRSVEDAKEPPKRDR